MRSSSTLTWGSSGTGFSFTRWSLSDCSSGRNAQSASEICFYPRKEIAASKARGVRALRRTHACSIVEDGKIR